MKALERKVLDSLIKNGKIRLTAVGRLYYANYNSVDKQIEAKVLKAIQSSDRVALEATFAENNELYSKGKLSDFIFEHGGHYCETHGWQVEE